MTVPESIEASSTWLRDSDRHNLKLNSLLSMVGLVVLGGTRVLYGSMVSRATDPETYGVVAVLIAVSLILSLILPGGLGSAISRFVPYTRGSGDVAKARALYRRLSLVSFAAASALGVAAAVGAIYLALPPSQVAEISALTVVYSLYVTRKVGLYAFDRVGVYVRLELVASVTTIGATLAVILLGATLYLLPLILGYGLFVVGSSTTLRDETRDAYASVTAREKREIARYVALACVGSLAGVGFLQATQLLAAQQASLTAAAYLAASITLISPLYLFPRALGLALFPAMAEAHGSRRLEVVRRHADLTTRALLVLPAPLFVAGQVVAAPVLALYGGAAFAAGALIFQIMLVGAYFAVVAVPSINALSSASGEQLRTPVGWAVAGATIGLSLVALMPGQASGTGIAAAYLVGTALTAAGPIAVVWHRYKMDWAGPVARAGLTLALAFVVARVLEGSRAGSDGQWLVDGIVALMVVAVAVLLLHRDIGAVLRSARPRGAQVGPSGSIVALDGATGVAGPSTPDGNRP